MARIAFFLVVWCLLCISCNGVQEPLFMRVENIEVTDIKENEVFLRGDALFFNPNGIGATLIQTDIAVFVNGLEVGDINQELSMAVPANSEFSIPLRVHFPFKRVLNDEKGLLKGLFNALIDKSVDVQYKGTVTLQFFVVKELVPIEYSEEVKFKK